MALKFSTGLRNYLLECGSFRQAFEDCAINIYSGTAPASADAAATGTLLAKVTLSSGAVVASTYSVAKQSTLAVGSHTLGHTFILTIDGVASTFTVTATEDTDAKVAAAIARMLSGHKVVDAISSAANVYIRGKQGGQTFTCVASGTGTGVLSDITASSALNWLQFDDVTIADCTIDKPSAAVWTGVALATGTAGYFRLVDTEDAADLSTTAIRLQGSVATSGGDLNLSNISLTLGATQTIDSFEFTMPEA